MCRLTEEEARRIRIKNWLALCFCQLERRPVSILAVNYLNPQGELFNEDKFRSNWTTHFCDYSLQESYDFGRELAHCLTFRRFEQ